jgi:hypothetical protein
MATQQMAIAERDNTAKTEGELSISLSEMLGLLALCEETEDSEAAERLDADVQRNVQQAISDKLRRYQGFFSFCEAQSSQCDSEIDRLRARKKAIDGAKDRLHKYLARAMEVHGVTRLDAGTVVFSLRQGARSLQITDVEKLPYQYKEERIVTDIDKPALKRALEAGEPVEGAELTIGDPFVVVR